MRTRDEINADIVATFRLNGVTPLPGDEGFWEAVEYVDEYCTACGDFLRELSKEWEAAT